MEERAAVEIKEVTKTYQLEKTTFQALKGVDLTIPHGAFTAIAGCSGSGKSTLLNLIGCLDQPSSGEIYLKGKKIDELDERALDHVRLNTIGFVFQTFNLIPVLNIYENIELPLLIRKDMSSGEKKERVEHFMECVGLADKRRHKPSELSGGQRQRIAVARALVTAPEIVLADEPTANLDSKTGIEIIELMARINEEEKTTFVFSTHDTKVLKYTRHITWLEDGLIIKEEDQEGAYKKEAIV